MTMKRKNLSNVLMPDDPMYVEAVNALRRYHEAEAAGIKGAELERLRRIAESQFQAVTEYQLGALGGSPPRSH